MYMDMNIATLPKKDLKTRPYSIDMEDHIATLPKKDLKTRPYSMDMNKEDNIVTPSKKDFKTKPYNMGMEKKISRNYLNLNLPNCYYREIALTSQFQNQELGNGKV